MDDFRAKDAKVLWHPATHFGDLERLPPLPVARASGSFLYDLDGRPILDAISSWWTALHGHCHPRIVAAMTEQVATLDHVMFAGFTHAPAISLAEQLLEAAPAGYGKVFFSDSGSSAVEIAMKLSFQARLQGGEGGRGRFAALKNSYHGETLGALALSANDDYRATFSPLLVEVTFLPSPSMPTHRHDDLSSDAGADSPEAEEAIASLRAHAHELTALIIEPIVQCAGKMRMPGAGFIRRITQEAQSLGIHVIADEIAVAFGRTGRLFASEWSGVTPDLMCLSKGLSGGMLPLACTLVREGLEDVFRGHPSRSFMHSHTFTANPVACAAGLASLDLLREERLPSMPAQIAALGAAADGVASACDAIAAHRQAGMIVAFDLQRDDAHPGPVDGRISLSIREAALRRGVLLRPLHDTVYWMPPLNLSSSELAQLAEVTVDAISEVMG